MPATLSPLAQLVPKLKDVTDRTAPVWGVCVHTTGSGIVEQAQRHGADPLEWAVAYYLKPESYFAHYVVGYDGTIVQLADEKERAPHVGFSAVDRAAYLDGSWVGKVSPRTLNQWRQSWSAKSPAHLFPGPSPNNVYVGAEMLPLPKPCDDAGHLYTPAQHRAVVELASDVARRWGWPDGWWATGRLCGHEDLNPVQRQNAGGGWDPGSLRTRPWFDFEQVRQTASIAGA